MPTQKCILVKRGSKGQCVCAKRISKAEAEALGIDWAKIPSFAELCLRAGIHKIIVGSTKTTAEEVLKRAKERKQLGGLNMPEREYKYPLIEGMDDVGEIEEFYDTDDVLSEIEGDKLGQISEAVKNVLPSFRELQELCKGIGGMAGAFMVNKYVVDKFISEDKWYLRPIVKIGAGLVVAKLLVQKVDPSVGVGYGLYNLWDGLSVIVKKLREKSEMEQLPSGEEEGEGASAGAGSQAQSQALPGAGAGAGEGGQAEVGQYLIKPENEYLLGTELYRPEELEDVVYAMSPEEAIEKFY